MKMKNVVVGAGFAGAIIARRIAEELDEEVLVVEKHNHIAGHAYDYYNEHGVLIHKYGPHIFHTNDRAVWDWLSRFTAWNEYQHRVLAYIDGRYAPLPLSVETVNEIFGLSLSTAEFPLWIEKNREPRSEIRTSEDVILNAVGRELYEKIFFNYTKKQWDRSPAELDASVTKRIPLRMNRDLRYFSDTYQGLPKVGYTELFRTILDHPRIHVLLNTPWESVEDSIQHGTLFYTGAIDRYFKYAKGKLEYRSVRFEYETLFDRPYFQAVGTVNYPNDYAYTRITEFKYLTGQKIAHTTIAREYSSEEGEPFYIVPGTSENPILDAYRSEAEKRSDLRLIGRLAEYKYYNMDQIAARALAYPLA